MQNYFGGLELSSEHQAHNSGLYAASQRALHSALGNAACEGQVHLAFVVSRGH